MIRAMLLLCLLAAPPPKTTVYLFTRTDCPISNRYAPEVKRLYERYGKPVDFILVYPDRDLTAEAREKHRREFGYPMPAIPDPRHDLVRKTGVRVTPEAAVYVGARLVYRGRIDDRYVAFGQSRPAASKHDLDEVLAAIESGGMPAFRETKAIGCAIDDLR